MIETWTRWKPENVKVPIKCYLSNFLDENNILSFSIEPYREEKEWNENERTKNKIVKVSFNQNII